MALFQRGVDGVELRIHLLLPHSEALDMSVKSVLNFTCPDFEIVHLAAKIREVTMSLCREGLACTEH